MGPATKRPVLQRAAKQQIQTWTTKYAIDVSEAYRKLADHFAGC